MPPRIEHPEANRPPPEEARVTGETITLAVVTPPGHHPTQVERTPAEIDAIVEEAKAIVRRFDSRPVLDNRSAEEILGYDEIGLPR
jgi:antitoxin VapB